MKFEARKDPALDFRPFDPEYGFAEPGLLTYIQPEDDLFRFRHVQDIRGLYKENASLRDNTEHNWGASKEMKKVAQVPLALWLEWERLGIAGDSKALLKAIELNPETKTTTKRLT